LQLAGTRLPCFVLFAKGKFEKFHEAVGRIRFTNDLLSWSIMSAAAPPTVYNETQEMPLQYDKVVFVGPPGCGKSFLLNAMVGADVFKSEQVVSPVTMENEWCYLTIAPGQQVILVNGPGIRGITRQKKAAAKLTKALKGKVLLVFVLTTENGRVGYTSVKNADELCYSIAKSSGILHAEIRNRILAVVNCALL
jgi:predicted GTPase